MDVRDGFIDSHRQHAADPADARLGGDRLRDPRQGRVPQPGQLGEGPGGAGHHPRTPSERGSSSRAASSSRAPPATPASAWRWSATRAATARVIVIPETQSQEKKDMLRLCGAEVREVPAVPYRDPEQLREAVRPAGRGAGQERAARRDLGQPVRQRRQPAAATSRPPARKSGARPTAGSTASSAPSAPAARLPASGMLPQGAQPERDHRPRRSDGRRALQLVHVGRAEGGGRIRSPRASARAGSPPTWRVRRSIAPTRSPTRRRCRSSSTCCEHEGLCLGGSSGINVAGAIRLARDLGPGHVIVTILCDYGTRYQSKLFNPAFLRSKGLPVPDWLDRR